MPSSESPHLEIMRMSAVLFTFIGRRIPLDGERLNAIVNQLAPELYDAGFRLPNRRVIPDDLARQIASELYPAARALSEFRNVPSASLRRRVGIMSLVIASRGYRKVV
jgi:hypothetical protein